MSEFEEIYKAYFSDVYKYIRRLSGSETVAEEITSETFFKALRSFGKFRYDCEIRVWLCQIAKNCYYSYLKKNSRIKEIDETVLFEIPDTDQTPEERISDISEANRIRTILHTIPEPYKEVFMWRVYAELDFKQIGAMFSKSENWACVTYHRARAMIKKQMEDE